MSHTFYTWPMTAVPSRELRNDTRGVLRRAETGEPIEITVDGRPVAALVPLVGQRRWISRADLTRLLDGAQADHDLGDELRRLVPDSTDDL